MNNLDNKSNIKLKPNPNLNQITNALINTFPDLVIKIKIKTWKIEVDNQNNYFNCCENINVIDEINKTKLEYHNPIFSFELQDTKLIFKTKYLSPCMYILDKYYKSYDFDNNTKIYKFEMETEDLKIMSQLNEPIETKEHILIFNSENIIPFEYIKMLIDFVDLDKNNQIESINYEFLNSKININFKNFLLNINNFIFDDNFISKSYNDFTLDLDIELTILNSDWVESKPYFKLPFFNLKNKSGILCDDFLKWVNNTNFTIFTHFLNKPVLFNGNYINPLYSIKEGLELKKIFLTLPYSQINKIYFYSYDIYIHKMRYNIKENVYSCIRIDLLTMVILNELLIKYGIDTKLKIKSKIYPNIKPKPSNIIYDLVSYII